MTPDTPEGRPRKAASRNIITPPQGTDVAVIVTDAGLAAVSLAAINLTALAACPRFHVGALPHLAHVKRHLGCREVLAADELLDTLAADTEHAADLGRSHEVMHGGNHRHHDSSHLTSGQEVDKTSHMTSGICPRCGGQIARTTLADLRHCTDLARQSAA